MSISLRMVHYYLLHSYPPARTTHSSLLLTTKAWYFNYHTWYFVYQGLVFQLPCVVLRLPRVGISIISPGMLNYWCFVKSFTQFQSLREETGLVRLKRLGIWSVCGVYQTVIFFYFSAIKKGPAIADPCMVLNSNRLESVVECERELFS